MVKNRKVTGRARSIPVGMAVGWGIGLLVTVSAAAILTQIILSGAMSERMTGVGAYLILPMAAALDALVAASMIKRRWAQVCLGAGGLYFLTLLGISALLFGGQYQGVGISLLLIMGSSAAVGMLGSKREKHTSGKRKIRHYG